jgi:hypothetical protein
MKRRRFAKKLVDNLDIREIWIKTAADDGRQLWCFGLMDTYVAGRSFGLEFKGLLLVELGQVFVGFLEVSEGCGHFIKVVERSRIKQIKVLKIVVDSTIKIWGRSRIVDDTLHHLSQIGGFLQVVWNKNSTGFTVLQ